jgi:hypothetical protein
VESDTSNSGERPNWNYVDAEGFVRKRSDGLGYWLWIGVGVANVGMRYLPSEFVILELLTVPISAYLLLTAIQMVSTHDIKTWKGTPYVKLWIFLGCFVGMLGLIVYYLLKWHERAYLKRTMHSAKINP